MIGDLFDSPWKIAIIAILIIVLFGSRKLPDAARSLGKSMRILKKEVSRPPRRRRRARLGRDRPGRPGPAPGPGRARRVADAQAQIDALSKQLADLQQSVKTTDSAQAK